MTEQKEQLIRNFSITKKRFVEGEDFFTISNSEIRKSHIIPLSDNDYMDKIFLTETGYLMLVKSFTDDLAWDVQRSLVKSYFRKRNGEMVNTSVYKVEPNEHISIQLSAN